MSCHRVLPRLHAYADEELPRFRARRIARHLETCASCRARLGELRDLDAFLGGLSLPPMPDGFSERLLAQAARRMPEHRPELFPGWLPKCLPALLTSMSVPMRVAALGTALFACLLGVTTAGRIGSSSGRAAPSAPAQGLQGLEWFGSAPPLSIATVYLADASPTSREGTR